MPMFAWWRDQCRETIEELHRRQHQADTALWAGLHALVDQMLRVDFTQAFQREDQAGAIPQQTFQTIALARLDAYVCIDREAAAVFPLGHHPRVLRRQRPAPQDRAQQSPAHGGLNLPDRGHIQCAGRVKSRPPPVASASNTPSTTTQWKCRWVFSSAPKRRIKTTAPWRDAALAPGLYWRSTRQPAFRITKFQRRLTCAAG